MGDDTCTPEVGSIDDAVRLARTELADSWGSPNQSRRVAALLEQFVAFAQTGYGVDIPQAVTADLAAAFVHAPLVGGTDPSVPLMHLRRSALRLMFRAMRQSGVPVGDPTLDIELPARSQVSTRPLGDDEVTLCRAQAMWSLTDSRRAAAWALAEATCRSIEVAQIRVGDVDLEGQRVWIHGGRTTAPRCGILTAWGAGQLERRLQSLSELPETLIVYGGSGSDSTGQVSSCIAISDVLTRAGLASESDVRPASVAAWAGRQVLAETGRIDEVARRLGMSSLDRAARFIGFDWSGDGR